MIYKGPQIIQNLRQNQLAAMVRLGCARFDLKTEYWFRMIVRVRLTQITAVLANIK